MNRVPFIYQMTKAKKYSPISLVRARSRKSLLLASLRVFEFHQTQISNYSPHSDAGCKLEPAQY
jgi:hypothetical protein